MTPRRIWSFCIKGCIHRWRTQNWGALGPVCGRVVADPLKTSSPPHMCYHVKFGRSALNDVHINRRKPHKLGNARAAPPKCGVAWLTPGHMPLPTRFILPIWSYLFKRHTSVVKEIRLKNLTPRIFFQGHSRSSEPTRIDPPHKTRLVDRAYPQAEPTSPFERTVAQHTLIHAPLMGAAQQWLTCATLGFMPWASSWGRPQHRRMKGGMHHSG